MISSRLVSGEEKLVSPASKTWEVFKGMRDVSQGMGEREEICNGSPTGDIEMFVE